MLLLSSRRSDGGDDLHCVRAAFTLSYSDLPFPQDATFFQCEQIFFVFISQVYINKNVLLHLSVVFCGRAEGVHSLELNSRSANLTFSSSMFEMWRLENLRIGVLPLSQLRYSSLMLTASYVTLFITLRLLPVASVIALLCSAEHLRVFL